VVTFAKAASTTSVVLMDHARAACVRYAGRLAQVRSYRVYRPLVVVLVALVQ
jgi:hypothetical protein